MVRCIFREENMKKVEIKKIQQWELEVLTVFDTICRQNDIKYSLSGGLD